MPKQKRNKQINEQIVNGVLDTNLESVNHPIILYVYYKFDIKCYFRGLLFIKFVSISFWIIFRWQISMRWRPFDFPKKNQIATI